MEVLRRDTADPVIDQLPETILQQEERGRGTKEALAPLRHIQRLHPYRAVVGETMCDLFAGQAVSLVKEQRRHTS